MSASRDQSRFEHDQNKSAAKTEPGIVGSYIDALPRHTSGQVARIAEAQFGRAGQ